MAEEQTPVTPTEPTLDEQLEALVGIKETAPLGEEIKETAPEISLDDRLSKIEEPKIEEVAKPTQTPEQQRITALVPDVATAEQLTTTAQNYTNFTQAFMNGDFENVEGMFRAWNEPAFEAFLEHVYEKRVAGGENEWVNRWIADKEGSSIVNRQVDMLKRELQAVKQQLQGRHQQEQTQQTQAARQAAYSTYQSHLTSLLDQLKCPAEDRRWITEAVNSEAGKNQQVLSGIFSGKPNAVNGIFKSVYKDYMQRDQAATQVKAGVVAAQEKHKLPLQSGNIATSTISDEQIKAAPKNKRDELLDAKLDSDLNNFLAGVKNRR